LEVGRSIRDDQRHARPAFSAGDRHAVDRRLADAGAAAQDHRDFGRRDILALPAESVADAVDEIVEALRIDAHAIAAAHIRAARREDVAQDLLLGVGRAGVAFEARRQIAPVAIDPADRLARLALRAADAEA